MNFRSPGRRPTTRVIICRSIVSSRTAARTTQALSNVLDNALKYTAAGGSVWIKLTIEDKDAVVRIEDNGSGIAAATLPHIFDLFTREERAERAVPQGLGIGLALVKAIVDAHHGSVEARSAGEDRGSEFVIRLPLGR